MNLSSPVPPVPRTILFLARSLDRGGAERQLVVLVKGLVRNGHAVSIALFYGGALYEAELADAGVRIIHLNKAGRWDIFPFLLRLVHFVSEQRPAVLHSYLGLPNIVAIALKPIFRETRIVWGVRASNMDLSHYDLLTRLAYALECRLSRFADCIISNSHAGKCYAVNHGFPESNITVIANGIDTHFFQYDPIGRRQVRAEWEVGDNKVLIGLVARLDPMKGHTTFLDAASSVARERNDVHFVCVGDGPSSYVRALKHQSTERGLANRLIWASARDDMPSVYSALDISTSSSWGEGFSNTIAEAMACGVPCVATDVGDSAQIVGGLTTVVPPQDSSALARVIRHLVYLQQDERKALGASCRARIVSEFGIERLIRNTEHALGLT